MSKARKAAATKHALSGTKMGEKEVKRVEEGFGIDVGDPKVFWRAKRT